MLRLVSVSFLNVDELKDISGMSNRQKEALSSDIPPALPPRNNRPCLSIWDIKTHFRIKIVSAGNVNAGEGMKVRLARKEGREGGRKEGREGGREGGREEGRKGGREEGREKGGRKEERRKEGRKEGRREGRKEGREGGRKGGREEGRKEGM